MNDAACSLFQYDRKELLSKPGKSMNSACYNQDFCEVLKLIEKSDGQTAIQLQDHHYLVHVAQIQLTNQTKSGFIEVLQDVTQVMQVQSILEEKTIELETISENLIGGVLITELDEEYTVIRSNPGYLELIGIEEAQLKAEGAMKWGATKDIKLLRNVLSHQLQSNEPVNIEHRIIRKDGEKLWVSLYGKKTVMNGHEVGIWMVININQRKQTQQQLMINEERYRLALENTEDIIIEYDIKTRTMYHSHKVTEVYGVDQVIPNAPEGIVQAGVMDSESIVYFLKSLQDIEEGKPKAICILKTITKDKQILWKRSILTNIFNEENKPERAIGILQDITKEQEANIQYQKEAHYREVTMQDHALYYEINVTQGQFIKGHETLMMKVLGHLENDYDRVTEALLDSLVWQEDREYVRHQIDRDFLLQEANQGQSKIEFEYRRILSEKPVWVICTLYLLVEEDGVKALCYIKDNEEVKQKEFALKQKAEKDLLTGFYNKVTTENKIDEWLIEKKDCFAALLLLDLDNFKNVNDTLGHAFGDAVLSEVSRKLGSCCQDCDICGRIGGDEFVVFLTQISSLDQTKKLAQQICKELADSYTGHPQMLQVSVSLGIALAPIDGNSFQQLYQKSDIALYYSKKQGKNMFSIYTEELPKMDGSYPAVAKKIDENAGKLFSENIVEYVLRILYGAPNPMLVISGILELVSKNFGYSRGYLFEISADQTYWKQSYEWCSSHVKSMQQDLQHIDSQSLKKYWSYFNRDGVFLVNNTADLKHPFKEFFHKKQVQSFIQCVMIDNNVAKAFIGFDDCLQQRQFDEKEINILHMITMLIGTALLNYKKNE